MKTLDFTISNTDLIEYKKKTMARKLVSKFIKLGKLQRGLTCELCSEFGATEAHHTDYGQPLKVMWLCDACHGACHRHDSIYNPKNIYQTPLPMVWEQNENITVSFTMPARNFIAIKKHCENEKICMSKVLRDCITDKYKINHDQLNFNFEENNELVAKV